MEAIRYQGLPCNSLPDLWHALHLSYNAAANCSVQLSILDDVPCLAPRPWVSFSMLEMSEALKACSNVSAPGPDHITWRYLKSILADDICASGILSLANSCITLRHWPQHFKESVSVIIPKPGKPAYDTPKALRHIVLLNTLGKLIEKMIARRLQFDAIKHSVLHPNQLGGIAQRSTEDAGLFLTHLVRSGWAKGLKTSVVDAELFAIQLGVIKATSFDIKRIVIITDSLTAARRAVDASVHSGQAHSLAIHECLTWFLFLCAADSFSVSSLSVSFDSVF